MRGAQARRAARAIGGTFAAVVAAAVLSPAGWASADTTPPSVPSGFRVVSSTETTLTVEWAPSTDASGVTQYWTAAIGGNVGEFHPTTQPRFTFTGLSPDKQYAILAQAVDGAGNYSAQSQPFTGRTRADTAPPSVPGAIRATPTLGHASVNWSASSDNHKVDRYELSVDGSTARPITTTQTSAQARNMAPASTHTFAVRAVDASGNRSAWSAPIQLTMPDAADKTAPAAPTGLRLHFDPNWTPATLVWNPTTDNADSADRLEYALYADGVEFAFIGNRTRFETFDANLCIETMLPGTHTYTVRATDRSGNLSPPSNAVVFTR